MLKITQEFKNVSTKTATGMLRTVGYRLANNDSFPGEHITSNVRGCVTIEARSGHIEYVTPDEHISADRRAIVVDYDEHIKDDAIIKSPVGELTEPIAPSGLEEVKYHIVGLDKHRAKEMLSDFVTMCVYSPMGTESTIIVFNTTGVDESGVSVVPGRIHGTFSINVSLSGILFRLSFSEDSLYKGWTRELKLPFSKDLTYQKAMDTMVEMYDSLLIAH